MIYRHLHDLAPKTLEELMKGNLSTVCPSCGDTITLIPQHQPINDSHDYSSIYYKFYSFDVS